MEKGMNEMEKTTRKLTLEELKGMDGKIISIIHKLPYKPGKIFYGEASIRSGGVVITDEEDQLKYGVPFDLYEKDWVAYEGIYTEK